MLQKNKTIHTTVASDALGQGLSSDFDRPLWIPATLAGEEVEAKVLRVDKRRAFGKCLQITQPSIHRQAPPCEVAHTCGGCDLQHVQYAEQCRQKEAWVAECLAAYPTLNTCNLKAVLPAPDPFHYRNKAQFAVQWTPNKVTMGLYASRSIRVVDTERCHIQHSLVEQYLAWHQAFFNRYHSQYDANSWPIRHLVIRVAAATQQVMVALVAEHDDIPFLEEWVSTCSTQPHCHSIKLNINTDPGNVVLGPTTTPLWGDEQIMEQLQGLDFSIGLHTFFQSNPQQAEALLQHVLEGAQLTGNERVADLYCGVGSITLPLAHHAKSVVGIEEVPQSIEAAKKNANTNGISNADFICGKVEDTLAEVAADVVVLDPPRKGCEPSVIRTLCEQRPQRLVYVSCNPKSFARDADQLVQGGFTLQQVHPVDMFPQTPHVEIVAVFYWGAS